MTRLLSNVLTFTFFGIATAEAFAQPLQTTLLSSAIEAQTISREIARLRTVTKGNAEPLVVQSLDSPHATLRKEAVCTVMRLELQQEEIASQLLNKLQDKKEPLVVRLNAASALFQTPESTKRIGPDGLTSLRQSEPVLRYAFTVFEVLQHNDFSNLGMVIKQSAESLRQFPEMERKAILKDLFGLCPEAKWKPVLIAPFLSDSNETVRLEALRQSALLGKTAISIRSNLLQVLLNRSERGYLRSLAADALGSISSQEDAPLLLTISRDNKNDTLVRSSTVRALGNLGASGKPYLSDLVVLGQMEANAVVKSRAWETVLKIDPEHALAREQVLRTAREGGSKTIESGPITQAYDLNQEALSALKEVGLSDLAIPILRENLRKPIPEQQFAINFIGDLGSNGVPLIGDMIQAITTTPTGSQQTFLRFSVAKAIVKIYGGRDAAAQELSRMERAKANPETLNTIRALKEDIARLPD